MNTSRAPRIAAAALVVAASLTSHAPSQGPDTLNMSPTAPTTGNTPPLVVNFPDHLFLGAAEARVPFVFPGVLGALQIDPSLIIVVPGRAGFGPELVPVAPLIPASTPLIWQVLGDKELGLQFSPNRPIGPTTGFTQIESESDCRQRAVERAGRMAAEGLAPGWQGQFVIGAATPFFRPDVQGVAYYHFAVNPGGHIVLSTGDHDAPVSHWNDTGTPLVASLQERAGENGAVIKTFYRMDSLSWAGEDAAGNLVAQIGQLPPKLIPDGGGGYKFEQWDSWTALKNEYEETYRPMLDNEAMRVAGLWQIERNGNDGPWSSWSTTWVPGGTAGQCLYKQFPYLGCEVGCGSVAWAMMFGWADRRAAMGDPNWAHRWGLYRQNGGYGADATASPLDGSGARNMIRAIRDNLGTFCIVGQGATVPGDMHQADRYLSGRTFTTLTSNFDPLGIHNSGLHDLARDEILIHKKPAILGTGFLSHYPVAVAFATRYRDESFLFISWRERENCFYLNMGWGGEGNGFYNTGTWFCGRIQAN